MILKLSYFHTSRFMNAPRGRTSLKQILTSF